MHSPFAVPLLRASEPLSGNTVSRPGSQRGFGDSDRRVAAQYARTCICRLMMHGCSLSPSYLDPLWNTLKTHGEQKLGLFI